MSEQGARHTEQAGQAAPTGHELQAEFGIVGAGLAGLTLARALRAAGRSVALLDKGRGAGGRMSTRREAGLQFDHGAQYFTARDPRFQALCAELEAQGAIAPWTPRLVSLGESSAPPSPRQAQAEDLTAADPSRATRWVGLPGMSGVAGQLAQDLDVRFGAEAGRIEREGSGFRVSSAQGEALGRFERVLLATPAPQASKLLRSVAPSLAAELDTVVVAPCQAVMASFESPLELPFDAAFVREGPLAWIARESSKPGRAAGERWVLHATPAWSRAELETPAEEVLSLLLAAFFEQAGVAPRAPLHARAHRWRYALTETPHAAPCLYDREAGLGACGDGFGPPRVEGAFLSALALADTLLAG